MTKKLLNITGPLAGDAGLSILRIALLARSLQNWIVIIREFDYLPSPLILTATPGEMIPNKVLLPRFHIAKVLTDCFCQSQYS